MIYQFLVLVTVLTVASLACADELPVRPDDARTPGVIGSMDLADVCGRVDGMTYSQRHRQTTAAMKRDAYAIYGVERDGRDFEVDHRVPLCVGGADDEKNLWPQRGWAHPSYHDKDRLEAHVCRAVCRTHAMTLQQGQEIFLGDWIVGFKHIFSHSP